MIKAFQGTTSSYVLVLEAARYLGALTLLLRNFFQAIRRPPIESIAGTDEGYLVFVPICLIELASSNASPMILYDALV
jgi:hypothetical protein